MNTVTIAAIAYDAALAHRNRTGLPALVAFDDLRELDKSRIAEQVDYALRHADATPDELHNRWLSRMHKLGWKHGPKMDIGEKVSPSIVPWEQLPPHDQITRSIFAAIVDALRQHWSGAPG